MEWSRSETLGLAMYNCSSCHGSGMKLGRKLALIPCNCVLRSIFRICYDKFLRLVTQERFMSRVSVKPSPGRRSRTTWGRPDEEYIADFTLVTKRTLDAFHWKIFSYHFLLGADWKLCCRQLKIDRGNFFHAVYRIEQQLGRTFRELQPYALYPLDEYFAGPSRSVEALPRPVLVSKRPPLNPPMAPAPIEDFDDPTRIEPDPEDEEPQPLTAWEERAHFDAELRGRRLVAGAASGD